MCDFHLTCGERPRHGRGYLSGWRMKPFEIFTAELFFHALHNLYSVPNCTSRLSFRSTALNFEIFIDIGPVYTERHAVLICKIRILENEKLTVSAVENTGYHKLASRTQSNLYRTQSNFNETRKLG